MKNVFILTVALFLMAAGIELIPKGTNKILVSTTQSQLKNYEAVGNMLINKGYNINTNEKFFTISTEPINLPKLAGSYTLNFVIKDTLVIVTGKVRVNYAPNDWFILEKKGMKGSILFEAFKAMNETALSVDSITAIYYQQNQIR